MSSPAPRNFDYEPAPHSPLGNELLSSVIRGEATMRSAHGDPDSGPLTHIRHVPPRPAEFVEWPSAIPDIVRDLFEFDSIYSHQRESIESVLAGAHTVIATGTASGKSVAYQAPILTQALDGRSCAMYLSPTKALGVDQFEVMRRLTSHHPRFSDFVPCMYDGDTPSDTRAFARENSRMIFTNPDMLHLGILPGHSRWGRFFRHLKYVVVDECHHYRGVFGSHTSMVVHRLLRVAARYGSHPTVILASATSSNPEEAASRLIGCPVRAVVKDGSPHGAVTVALWEPPLQRHATGENSAPVRKAASTEAADIMADLVLEGARTLTFVRSRRGAELAAIRTRSILADAAPALADRVGSYRSGYLPHTRREIEDKLTSGEFLGVATTNALELGIDIAGLDAVVTAGFPGSIASFWQQAGRCGRRGQTALAILVARDDPLDTYLVHHPEALLGKPSEAIVTDPYNPYVLAPQLMCAAAELPLTSDEVKRWGAAEVVGQLCDQGMLRQRPRGWFIAPGITPHGDVNIRGGSGDEVFIVETETGQLLGTVDAMRAMSTVHPGAVYVHLGASYVVDELNLDDGIANVVAYEPDWTTTARSVTNISVVEELERRVCGEVMCARVAVSVSSQVVGFIRRGLDGEVHEFVELNFPPQVLDTRAVMYTVTPELLESLGVDEKRWPGTLHAAEHAAIGMLPLLASCDRLDIGGVSTPSHPDTGLPTVFVYDGHPGGAGFADRGFAQMQLWLSSTLDAITACECDAGCPSCVQSPKCGNGNSPLDKAGAARLLEALVKALR